jgi:hypothetical protein
MSEQPRAAHGNQVLFEEQVGGDVGGEGRPTLPNGDVHAIRPEVGQAFACENAKLDVGVGLRKVGEARNQPFEAKVGETLIVSRKGSDRSAIVACVTTSNARRN